MAWINPDNIITTNLDANTDSPALARADIKNAFDELTNIANNTRLSYTPEYSVSQGTVTITHTTQTGYYVQMGSMVYVDIFIDGLIIYSDADGYASTITINLPIASSTTSRYNNSLLVYNGTAGGGVSHPSGQNWKRDPSMWAYLTASSTAMGFRIIGDSPSSDIPILSQSAYFYSQLSGTTRNVMKIQGWYWA